MSFFSLADILGKLARFSAQLEFGKKNSNNILSFFPLAEILDKLARFSAQLEFAKKKPLMSLGFPFKITIFAWFGLKVSWQ